MNFALHPVLARDTLFIADWSVNRVCLMNDANYPWLVLIPRIEGLRDFHDIPAENEGLFLAEINTAARALMGISGAVKMNTAALGNSVPQLHVHVIARFENDPAWPAPVWGKQAPVPYAPGVAESLIERFMAATV